MEGDRLGELVERGLGMSMGEITYGGRGLGEREDER